MKNFFFPVILLISLTSHAQTLQQQFQHAIDSVFAANPDAIGFMVHIEAPDKNISWSYASGTDGKNSSQALSYFSPVLVASNTKPYVAATILRLVEEQKIDIGQTLDQLLSEKTKTELSKVGYQLHMISVKHLLSHTSGIRDYVDESYFRFIDEHKTHQWTRDEQIARAVSLGEPLAKAGEEFHYADVNYVLLTEIIENVTHKPFYKSMRSLLQFKKQDFKATWFINLEKKPKHSGNMAHQHWSEFSWEIDSLNPSWDLYGGGGIASTVIEMALFFQNLFTGNVIKDPSILAMMTQDVPPNLEINYCLGIRKIKAHDLVEYNHGGGLGTDVVYIPELNATIAISSIEASKRPIAVELSKELVRLLKSNE